MNSARSWFAAIAIAVLGFASPIRAVAQSTQDPHHPQEEGAIAPDAQGSMTVPQAGMMDMMRMMQMMHQGNTALSGMGMQGINMPGMPMTDHIEGRIAFLAAELKITDAQASAWGAFADALRLQAKRIADAHNAVGEAGAQSTGFEGQLASQETLLSARLDGIRAVKAAYGHLADTLSAEQEKIAEELLGSQMGMMRGAMMPPMTPAP